MLVSAMTLIDAKQYDFARDRRRRIQIISILIVILVLGWLVWSHRNWPEERLARQFFDALQKQDYETAYGIWMHDPQWKQHPEKYSQYPFNEFHRDWGPGGEWGLIKSYKIYGSATPRGGSSGVVVADRGKDRAEHALERVQRT